MVSRCGYWADRVQGKDVSLNVTVSKYPKQAVYLKLIPVGTCGELRSSSAPELRLWSWQGFSAFPRDTSAWQLLANWGICPPHVSLCPHPTPVPPLTHLCPHTFFFFSTIHLVSFYECRLCLYYLLSQSWSGDCRRKLTSVFSASYLHP